MGLKSQVNKNGIEEKNNDPNVKLVEELVNIDRGY